MFAETFADIVTMPLRPKCVGKMLFDSFAGVAVSIDGLRIIDEIET